MNNGAGNQPGMAWFTSNHTNSLVPLWAKGDAGRFFRGYADQMDPVRRIYLDNTELAQVLVRALQPVKWRPNVLRLTCELNGFNYARTFGASG